MKGIVVKDWSQVDLTDRGQQRAVMGCVQAFMNIPETPEFKHAMEYKASMQAFATKGDFPAEIREVLEQYHGTPTWDNAYEDIFDIRDFTATHESGFDLLTVESGLTFSATGIGMKAKIYKMSGEKVTVEFDRYSAGLQWDKTWFDDGKYWNVEDTTMEFREKAMSSRAQAFYDLIEAVPTTYDVVWENPVPATLPNTADSYTMNRDAQTMSKAAEEILIRLKDAGIGVTPATQFIILAPIQLRTRINSALAFMAQQQNRATNQVQYNMRAVFSLMLTTTTDYYVIVPKGRLKGGYRQNLTVFTEMDILQYADMVVGWMRYGGAVGDIKQISRCKTS